MSTDIEDLRRQERASRSAKIYSSPGMEQLRQAEGGLKKLPPLRWQFAMPTRAVRCRRDMQLISPTTFETSGRAQSFAVEIDARARRYRPAPQSRARGTSRQACA